MTDDTKKKPSHAQQREELERMLNDEADRAEAEATASVIDRDHLAELLRRQKGEPSEEDIKAMRLSLAAEVKEFGDKPPSDAVYGHTMQKAIHQMVIRDFEDRDGLVAVLKKGHAKGKITFWSRKYQIWREWEFTDGGLSITSRAYYDPRVGFQKQLGLIAPGWPAQNKVDRDIRAIASIFRHSYGKTEKDLERFDRLRVDDYGDGSRSRFLFGDRKVCEIWREDGQWHFRDGVANRRTFCLIKDFGEDQAAVADDYERKHSLPALLAWLESYCEEYRMARNDDGTFTDEAVEASPLLSAEKAAGIPQEKSCSTGNAWLDDFFITQASMFVPLPLRPLVCCIGPAGAGKSAVFRLLNAAYGNKILRIDLAKETFTDGKDGGTTAQRLLEHRAKLVGARGGVAMDLATNATLDSGFVKPFCSNEDITYGGMYKDDVVRPVEFTGYFSSNEMARLNDSSEGTTDRLWHLPFKKKYRGTTEEKTHEEMLEELHDLFPTLRRVLLDFIRTLAVVFGCKMPKQHPLLAAIAKQAFESSENAVKTYAKNFFVQVPADVEKGDFEWNYRPGGVFTIRTGGRATGEYGYPFGEGDYATRWHGFRALAAMIEFNEKNGEERRVVQQKTIKKILQEGQGWNYDTGRRAFKGVVHNVELIQYLADAFDNDRDKVVQFLLSFYHSKKYRSASKTAGTLRTEAEPLLLTAEMEAVFTSDEASDAGVRPTDAPKPGDGPEGGF